MTSIRAGWDALEKHVPASLKVSGVYYVTQSAAVRMSRLIQDLLQLANSGRPNRKLELAAIEPNSFCLQRYEKYEIYARQQRHPLRFKIEEAMTQIGSIFITNAVAHTRMIPLSISTANFKKRCCRNRGVQLWRRRCRTGFSANFEHSTRAGLSRTTSGHYGLGHSVVKSQAKQQSLQIGVLNVADGEAMFYICTREQYKGKSTAKEW